MRIKNTYLLLLTTIITLFFNGCLKQSLFSSMGGSNTGAGSRTNPDASSSQNSVILDMDKMYAGDISGIIYSARPSSGVNQATSRFSLLDSVLRSSNKSADTSILGADQIEAVVSIVNKFNGNYEIICASSSDNIRISVNKIPITRAQAINHNIVCPLSKHSWNVATGRLYDVANSGLEAPSLIGSINTSDLSLKTNTNVILASLVASMALENNAIPLTYSYHYSSGGNDYYIEFDPGTNYVKTSTVNNTNSVTSSGFNIALQINYITTAFDSFIFRSDSLSGSGYYKIVVSSSGSASLIDLLSVASTQSLTTSTGFETNYLASSATWSSTIGNQVISKIFYKDSLMFSYAPNNLSTNINIAKFSTLDSNLRASFNTFSSLSDPKIFLYNNQTCIYQAGSQTSASSFTCVGYDNLLGLNAALTYPGLDVGIYSGSSYYLKEPTNIASLIYSLIPSLNISAPLDQFTYAFTFRDSNSYDRISCLLSAGYNAYCTQGSSILQSYMPFSSPSGNQFSQFVTPSIANYYFMSCALQMPDQQEICWGNNLKSTLGSTYVANNTVSSSAPAKITYPTGTKIKQIAAGTYSVSSLAEDGTAYVRGVGNANPGLWESTVPYTNPTSVRNSAGPLVFTDIIKAQSLYYPGRWNDYTFCGLSKGLGDIDSQIYCWEQDHSFYWGSSDGINYVAYSASAGPYFAVYAQALSLPNTLVQGETITKLYNLGPDQGYTYRFCASSNLHNLYCYNSSVWTKIIDTSNTSTIFPNGNVVSNIKFSQFYFGRNYICGLTLADSTLLCWGNNTYGQLGTGDTIDRNMPVPFLMGINDF